jgi:phage baseplate assembly protein W
MQKLKYFPKLPLQLDDNGEFVRIEEKLDSVKQKLRTIILTNPGEKIMDPLFGVGLNRFLFEPAAGIITFNRDDETIQASDFNNTIQSLIRQQVAKYSNDIFIESVESSVQDEKLYISIAYNYRNLSSDVLELQVGA